MICIAHCDCGKEDDAKEERKTASFAAIEIDFLHCPWLSDMNIIYEVKKNNLPNGVLTTYEHLVMW